MKSIKEIMTISVMICFFVLLGTSNIYADKISPSIFETQLLSGNTSKGKLTYTNEETIPITITPTVSAYDPQNESLLSDSQSIFLIIDKDTYTVQPQTSLTLTYQIKPPSNLTPGSYFNIIILKKSTTSGYTTQKNQTSTVENLSQLVVLHIFSTDNNNTTLAIQGDWGQINMEVTDPGIPFLKPTTIKYTIQNITSYVLSPKGEIQVFDNKSSYSPLYKQINSNEKKLYPGESMEETITVSNWHISDILFGRKIVGHFYDGIDQNSVTKDQTENSYIIYIGIVIFIILVIIILLKARQKDKKQLS